MLWGEEAQENHSLHLVLAHDPGVCFGFSLFSYNLKCWKLAALVSGYSHFFSHKGEK